MSYRVTAPLVIALQENGTHVYLYNGAPVPSTVKADEVKRLKAEGMVDGSESEAASDGGAAAKSATKDEWVAFAESKGDANAADKTKEQLIADHG